MSELEKLPKTILPDGIEVIRYIQKEHELKHEQDLLSAVCSALFGTPYNEAQDHHIIAFPNGYGASIVNGEFTMGEWEIAVIIWDDYFEHYEVVYDTPITNDIIRCSSPDKVRAILKDISKLEQRRENGRVQLEG